MASATCEGLPSAFIFGAVTGVPIMISLPFQWNQIGMTRGVPSGQTYAKRAGILDRNNSCAIGSLSKAISPCFVIVPSLCDEVWDDFRTTSGIGKGDKSGSIRT